VSLRSDMSRRNSLAFERVERPFRHSADATGSAGLAPVALVPPIGAARPAIAGAVLVPGAIFLDYGARIAFSRSNLTARGLLAASIAYFLRFFCFARDGQEVSQT
jgi:hypothetical protein